MSRVTLGVILGLFDWHLPTCFDAASLVPGQAHGPSRSLLVALFARVLRRHDQLANVSDRGWPSRSGPADEHPRRDRNDGVCADFSSPG